MGGRFKQEALRLLGKRRLSGGTMEWLYHLGKKKKREKDCDQGNLLKGTS